MYLGKQQSTIIHSLSRHLCLDNKVVTSQRQGKSISLRFIARVLFHRLYSIKDFLVVILDEVCHRINRSKFKFACGYLRELTIWECLLHCKQMGVSLLRSLLCGFYLPLQLGLGIVNVGLVGFPLLPAALVLAHILLCIVFQQGIFATRELGNSVAEHIFFLFKHTVIHAVLHQSVTLHNAISNRAFGFQSLIGGYVKTILHTETKHTDWFTPFLVQVALSQYAAIALRVIHRTVWRIKVYKGMQTFLYVYTSTKGRSATENNTHLASVHLVEDFQLLFYLHARLHYDNLACRHTLLDEFLLDILIQVETAALILVVVSKDGYRTLVVVRFFQRTQSLAHSFVGLAPWIILSVYLYQSCINSCSLSNAIHSERYTAVFLLLLATHLLEIVQLLAHIFHHAAQCTGLWQIDVLRLTALHFWYLLNKLRLVFG